MNVNMKVVPSSIELSPLVDAEEGQAEGIGVRFHICQSWPQDDVDSVLMPFDADSALSLGAQLIAWSDWLAGRPERDWSKLTA